MIRVLIVGAGPAGASLAHVLAHRGIEVTLLERQRDFSREFRGEILMPSGVEAFEEMGLGEALAGVPSSRAPCADVYFGGRPLFHVELTDDLFGGRPPLALSQPALLEMLVAEAAKSPCFQLERGASVKELLIEHGRVVGVRAQTEEGERSFRADLVIGTDGRASAVRKDAGLTLRRADPPMDIVWCKIPCPDEWQGIGAFVGRGHLLVAYRSWDDQLQLGWVILKGTFGELRSRGIAEWMDEMANHVSPSFASHLRAHADAVQKPFLLDVVSDCVAHWSVPGALVLGDAAHAMSPVGGQGINIALRDTVVAANHLVPVLSGRTADPAQIDAACVAIEEERMQEVAPIQHLQAQPPRILLNRAWWGEPVRRALGALLRSERVRARAAPRIAAFPFGVTEVRLEV